MPSKVDLTNKVFGRLTVIKQAENIQTLNGRSHVAWECQCKCGNSIIVRGDNLRNGHTVSCGCKKTAAHADATARVAGLKKSEKTGRFETNIRAKNLTLVSPNGQIYHIKNYCQSEP